MADHPIDIAARLRERERHRSRAEIRAVVLSMPPDEHEDSVHDRALRLGMKGDTAGGFLWCRLCSDLPWRRQLSGCAECGGEFREELVTLEIATPQSSLYRAQEFGW